MPITHPSLSPQDAARADDLHDWLLSSRPLEWWAEDSRSDGYPRWYRRLHSELLLLTTGEGVEAVFVVPDLDTFVADVTVISTHRIAQAHVDTREGSDDHWVRAIPRRGIREVSVEERMGVIGREARHGWPGPIAITIHVVGLPAPLRLAVSTHVAIGGRTPDMHALLASLLANLSG